jgi:glyoxylase-like metal-dependent hydrolase (beta-lactamase superfamily II)
MTEPSNEAKRLEPVAPNLWRWHVADDRIEGGESDAYALVKGGRVVLIDPLPIAPAVLAALGKVESIVLTAANHQRSAWRLRQTFGAKVYAPAGSRGLDESPDHSYSGGDLLPGELMAFHAPGPTEAMHALWLERPTGVVFFSDLLTHERRRTPVFMPARYLDEPSRARASVRRILDDLPFEVACFAHGPPVVHDARRAVEAALDLDHEPLPTSPRPHPSAP